MNVTQRILLAKEESEYGTDASPGTSNAINAADVQINYTGDVLERNNVKSDLSPDAPVLGKRMAEVSFTCEIKGQGAAGTAPEIGDLFEACGLNEEVSGSSVIYTPQSAGFKGVTIYIYDVMSTGSLRLHKVTGGVGEVDFSFEAGQIARAQFSFKGIGSPITDVASISPSYDTTVPPIVESAEMTFNSETLVAQAVSLALGNQVSDWEDINAVGGLKGFKITGRRPSGSFNPDAVAVATYDFYDDWVESTQRALALSVGSTSGNKFAISCPKVTLDSIGHGDRNGILTEEIPIKLNRNSGGDEISITFS